MKDLGGGESDRKITVLLLIIILVMVGFLAFTLFGTPGQSSYYFGEMVNRETPITILFVGDIMLDRNVAKNADRIGVGALLENVSRIFKGNDLVIGNLEGTITAQESIARNNNEILRFTFDPKFISLLQDNNFSAVSLANNHALDFYRAGYEETRNRLSGAGISSFGHPNNSENLTVQLAVDGRIICFVGYHDLYTYDETPVIQEIYRIEQYCNHTVVLPHWGEEYELKQNMRQKMLAHKFIDSGADLVIGAHSHVVQPVEIYKNKAIFYSLGNFMFDQYFSFETTHGIAMKASISAKRSQFEIIPIEITNGKVDFAIPGDTQRINSWLLDDNMALNLIRDIRENGKFIVESI